MKKSFRIILLLLITFCLSSCKKEINPSAIYGIWNVQCESTTDGPRFMRLSFLEHNGYYYIDPVVSDTIYTYKNVQVKGDSLLLTDRLGHITLCTIDQLNDSVLTLSRINGVRKKVTYKKTIIHLEEGYVGHKHECVWAKDYSKDSLDIIMRTNTFWAKDNKDCQEIHGCTREEMHEAKALLITYMNKIKKEYPKTVGNHIYSYPGIDRMLPFDQYFRQYFTREVNGEKIILIDIATQVDADPGEGYTAVKRQSIGGVCDGGPRYGSGSVNLTKKKVLSFSINGNG